MPNNVVRFSRPVRKSSVHGGAVIKDVYEFTATDRPLMPLPSRMCGASFLSE